MFNDDDEFILHADLTPEERALQAKKEKKQNAAKKAAETRKRKKDEQKKQEEERFMKIQKERGYVDLFGN
jgi:hypothetical protein